MSKVHVIRTLFVLMLGAAAHGRVYAADVTVYQNVSVIPMTSETVLPDQVVVVRDGRIESLAPRADAVLPADAVLIDGAGGYLLPSFADMHVHFFGGPKAFPLLMDLYISNGVARVLCMGGSQQILAARDRIAAGEQAGPRIFSCSPIIGNFRPFPPTAAEGEAMVERYKAEGYDFIKVYNQIPKEGYDGIMAAAKRLEIPVIGHAVRSVGIEGAIASGQHVAHLEEFIYGYFQDGLDASRIEPLAQRLKAENIAVVSTLIVYRNIIRQVEDLDGLLDADAVKALPESITKNWVREKNQYLARFDAVSVEQQLGPHFAFMQRLAKAFQDAGVLLVTGTDSTMEVVVAGYSLHDELDELVQAGLTPYQALRAATVSPARFLGEDDSFGTLAPGQEASFLLLRANPLEDISRTRDIAGVSLRGQWYDEKAVSSMQSPTAEDQ